MSATFKKISTFFLFLLLILASIGLIRFGQLKTRKVEVVKTIIATPSATLEPTATFKPFIPTPTIQPDIIFPAKSAETPPSQTTIINNQQSQPQPTPAPQPSSNPNPTPKVCLPVVGCI